MLSAALVPKITSYRHQRHKAGSTNAELNQQKPGLTICLAKHCLTTTPHAHSMSAFIS